MALVWVSCCQADVLVWDVNSGSGGAQDGTGTWTAGLGNWFNQTQTLQNQVWVNGSDAVFGSSAGTAGIIGLSGPVTAGNLTFNAATSGTYTLGGTGVLTLVNATITNNAAATISAPLAGSTPWIKTGAGTLTLSGALSNTHSGTLTVNQGQVLLGKTGGATALAGNLQINAGAVTFSGGTNQIASTAAVSMSGASSVFNGTGVNAGAGTVTQTLASLTLSGGTFNSGAGSVWNIGAVSFAAGANRVFVGNSGSVQTYGSLSLVGMNGESSSSAVANGFTLFGNGASLANRTTLTIGAGGLSLNASRIHMGTGSSGSALVLNGDVTTSGTAGSSIERLTGGALDAVISLSGTSGTVSRTFNIGAGGADLNIAPSITNGAASNASLIKTGTGTLTLSGTVANTYTGDTVINAGTLALNKTAGIAAVAGNIVVNTGGTLTLSASHQLADTAGITVNGGTVSAFTTDETIAFYTQNSGGLSAGGNTGHMTINGALTLAGGNQFTLNSNPGSNNPGSWTVGSAILTGADILVGGNNGAGKPRTALTIGVGGLILGGRTITLNAGDSGVILNLNGDVTAWGLGNLANGGGAGVQPLVQMGAATRTFYVVSGTTTVSAELTSTGGGLTKGGAGVLQLTTANSYTGATNVSGGTLSMAGTAGTAPATSAVFVNGAGILQIGSSTAGNNNAVANRLNSAAALTLGGGNGGGTVQLMSAASGSSHLQTFTAMTVAGGANTVNVTAGAGSTATLNFAGASPYTRTAGTVNFIQNPGVGGSIVFTNAPGGAGNVSNGLLVGATLNGTDLVAAQAGVLTAFTGWIPTGTSTWTAAGAMDVTGTNGTAYTAADIAALRFNTAGPFTVMLDGTHGVTSDMILMTSSVGAGVSQITGGTLRGSVGGELSISQFNTSGSLEIASIIADNASATGLTKSGAGLLTLAGGNSYTGITRVSEGVLRAADGVGLPAGSALLINGGAFGSSAATFTRTLGTAAGQVAVLGSNSGFTAAGTGVTVNLGGSGATVQWGTASFDPVTLLLNAGTATAALDFANGLDLNGAQRSIRVDANTATVSGIISNSVGSSQAGIFKTGAGSLRLTQANTFDGGLQVIGGHVLIGHNNALGSGAVSLNGGSLRADGGARSITNSISLQSATSFSGTSTLTLAGVVSGTSGLSKSGAGVMELAGANSYTGSTTVTDGLLRLLNNNALGGSSGASTASDTGTIELANGVVVSGETITVSSTFGHAGVSGSPTSSRGGLQAGVNASAEWAGSVVIGADLARIGVQEGGTLILSGNITDGSNSFTVRFSGELTGTGGVILKGTGNTWDGQTHIVRGKLILGAHNTLPMGTVLDIHFTSSNSTEYAGVEMNGFNQTVGSLRNGGSSGTFAELTNSSRTLSAFTVNETGTATYGGIITGNLALVKNGAGAMTLTQANRFIGGVTVNDGILRIGHAGALATGDVVVNGGLTFSGRLDLNNTTTTINALSGSAGTISALISNESTTNATQRLTVGANHGSGTYNGQIADNSGGSALGKVALTKIGAGTLTLAGATSYTGSTLLSNGTLVADYASATAVLGPSAITLQGGSLTIRNAGTASIGNLTLLQAGVDFTTNTLRIEGTAAITTPVFSANGFAPLLLDISGGGSLVATSLSGATVTNGLLMGSSGRSTLFVTDAGGTGFATRNGSNEIVRYTAGTVLSSSSAATATTENHVINASLSRTADLNYQSVHIDTSAAPITLSMGASNLVVGAAGRTVLITGNNDATISATTGVVSGGSVFIANHGAGKTTLDISLGGQAFVNVGSGLVDYVRTANPADTYAANGVLRFSGATRDYSTSVVRIYGGGVLELGADLNGVADGDFTRTVSQSAGGVVLIGNGGFSAHGADRVVALGGVASPMALTWGTADFLAGPGGDNSYTLRLGSAYSTHTLELRNAINLGTRDRRVEVADGTSTTNVDGRLTGVLSGTGGGLIKAGTGVLEVTAPNTYTGVTRVEEGRLQIAASGSTGTGAVTVAAGAILSGTGLVQGSSLVLASGAALHAGNGTSSGHIGMFFMQGTVQSLLDFQAGSLVVLDIQQATNHGMIDPTFGGNAIGSAGYQAYVDSFSGQGSGIHDLLLFGGPAGSMLNFGGNLLVRPEGFTAVNGQIFNLMDWVVVMNTDFSTFNIGSNYRTGAEDDATQFDLPQLSGGLLWDVSRFTTSGIIVVVPEPSRVLLIWVGLLSLLGRRRREGR